MSTTYHQAALPISDPKGYGDVHSAIESAFSNDRVAGFLQSLERGRLRIRNFEDVLGKGLLGDKTRAAYAGLDSGDQGQIREFYLASLERIAPELRTKFFKLYAYY